MSDVIEAMARELYDAGYSGEGYSPYVVKEIIRAAEKAGWRLVPVRASQEMIEEGSAEFSRYADMDECPRGLDSEAVSEIFWEMVRTSPRPWDEVKNDS